LSSPNTPGLTGLQEGAWLAPLLSKVREARDRQARRVAGHQRALFLKLSPDLSTEARKTAVELAVAEGFGLIASNTSRRRDLPLVESANAALVAEEGGLSGAPLRALAVEQLKEIRAWAGAKTPLISVGGLSSGADARERLEAGANFLQVYTEFVYAGPSFPRNVMLELSRS
jgi:dihydroorotate dehydrogenase